MKDRRIAYPSAGRIRLGLANRTRLLVFLALAVIVAASMIRAVMPTRAETPRAARAINAARAVTIVIMLPPRFFVLISRSAAQLSLLCCRERNQNDRRFTIGWVRFCCFRRAFGHRKRDLRGLAPHLALCQVTTILPPTIGRILQRICWR